MAMVHLVMVWEEKRVVPAWYSGSLTLICTRITWGLGLKYIILSPTAHETLFWEVWWGAWEAAFYFSGSRVIVPQGTPGPCLGNTVPKGRFCQGAPRLSPGPVLVGLLGRDLEKEVGGGQGCSYMWTKIEIEHGEGKSAGT